MFYPMINDNVPREPGAAQLSLDEELGVEELGRRVERSSGDRRVDLIGRSDGVPTNVLVSNRVNRRA